jgi:hypothetical protein
MDQGIDTRTLGLVGGGVLAAIVVVTLVGIPPTVWIMIGLVALVIAIAAVWFLKGSQSAGVTAEVPGSSFSAATTVPRETAPAGDVVVELVREADDTAGVPAVWLHRRGGRRVHRFWGDAGWVVQQVSTKDPDNPRKRIIGEPRVYATEADAMRAADELARGDATDSNQARRQVAATARA